MNKTDEILQVLRDELREGRYPKGGRFPSEYALMHRFGVSRPTINKVTSMLENDGYIARGVRGAGTTVLASSTFPVGHIAYIGPIAHLYSARIIDGIQKTALFNNYAVSFFCPGNDLLELWRRIVFNMAVSNTDDHLRNHGFILCFFTFKYTHECVYSRQTNRFNMIINGS